MVQPTGPEAEEIRARVLIEFSAQLQAANQASQALEKLAVDGRNAAGQFATLDQASQRYRVQFTSLGQTTRTFSTELEALGQELVKISQSFSGEKIISSAQGVQQQLLLLGQTARQYAQALLASKTINEAAAGSLNNLGQEAIKAAVTGNVTTESINQLALTASRLQPSTIAGAAGIKQLQQSLQTLVPQLESAALATEQRLNRQLTSTQKLGQGMLLSFSLAQGAAGNLSAAFFGLGFALIFTGFQFLNLITVASAVSIAFAGIALEKLQERLSKVEDVAADVSKTMQNLERVFANSQGEAALLADEFERLAASGEDVVGRVSAAFTEAEKVSFFEAAKRSILGFGKATLELGKIAFLGGLADDFGALNDALKDYIDAEGQIKAEKFQEATELMEASITGTADSIRNAINDITKDLQRAGELEIAIAPIEIERERLQEQFDIVKDAIKDRADVLNDAVREETDNQIEVRRKALQIETDAIRDAVDEQISIYRDALEEQTDNIRDRLQEQIDEIRKQSEIRIDSIKDAAEQEIDINKERIDKLQEQDKELTSILSDLQSRRASIRAETIGAEATLAALEAEQARSGALAKDEMAIVTSRIAGLEAEGKAIDAEISQRQKARDSISDQIESIEDLIDKIEETREKAVSAAKEEADARSNIAKNAADDEIKEAQRATDGKIKEARRAADAAADAARDRADAEMDAVRESADAQIEANNEVADKLSKHFDDEERRRLDILKIQEDEVKKQLDIAKTLEDRVIPAVGQLIALQLLASQKGLGSGIFIPWLTQLILGLQNMFPGIDINKIFSGLNIPSRQLGGIVPGPIGQPRLIMAHGGEEVIERPALPSGDRSGFNFVFNIENFNAGSISDMARMERMISRATGNKINLVARSRKYMSR